MTVATLDGQVVLEAVKRAVEEHGATIDELIPILTDVNRALGYLPAQALDEISQRLRVPKSQLFSVSSFYRMLSTKPRGRHVIQFCESAPCHVVGGRKVWQSLLDNLDLEPGETSPDGKWTLVTTSCLGVCGVGPVMIVDDDIYGNILPEQVAEILARYS
ncbi:NADH:ubiquinone oxidoreductase 24 kD subunit [Longilinea arvoryzae]|uniref:NADH:ubiquinone oxidoreductase 24 kD subunit n=1 Tax=Longilinea arvoryzae TaxID=360412 RepID=A0A0S7BIE5_9CHLR|nr:NADH-quinone oxidoreductase subunit NuoE [Longilinea arvoryzae]GAP14928.1 NADH:ubiquinone oxidoreductase 24 kD subunit [Longilinea arvoryzae]